jgi:ParB/RepB/Spo0J family partition protein
MTSTLTDLTARRSLRDQGPLRTARIPLTKLRVHPRHIRADMGDLAELADSLTYDGQHQMIEVERRGAFFQILDGHRRFGAAALAGLRTLEAEIVPARTDADALAIMLTTGVHTKPLSPAERARAVRELIDAERVPTAEIAARCGVTPDTIRRWYHADTAGADPAAAVAVVPRPRRTTEDDRPRKRRTTIGVTRLTGLVDRWSDRCATGLSAEHAQALLTEIRDLTRGQLPSTGTAG